MLQRQHEELEQGARRLGLEWNLPIVEDRTASAPTVDVSAMGCTEAESDFAETDVGAEMGVASKASSTAEHAATCALTPPSAEVKFANVIGEAVDVLSPTDSPSGNMRSNSPANQFFVEEAREASGAPSAALNISACEFAVPWALFTLRAEHTDERLGFVSEALPPEPFLIEEVIPNSWSERVGVSVGDMLILLDGNPVSEMDVEQVLRYIRDARPLLLGFARVAEQTAPPNLPGRPRCPRAIHFRKGCD